MKVKTDQIDYPKVALWRTRIAPTERLKIVNPGDFPKDSILKGLGINQSPLVWSFGISNREEIVQRHALIGFLLKHPEFAEFIRKVNDSSPIPIEGQKFLNYYDPEFLNNPHWQNVHRFLSILKDCTTLPSRLQEVEVELKKRLWQGKTESSMGADIAKELEKISVIEGLINFKLYYNGRNKKISLEQTGKTHIHGHQLYSFAINQARKLSYPGWVDKWWHPGYWIGIGKIKKWLIDRANKKEERRAYQEMIINQISSPLVDDIKVGVNGRLSEVDWEELSEFAKNNGMKLDESAVKVYFSYSKTGLIVQIYAIDPHVSFLPKPDFRHNAFAGYSNIQKVQIQAARMKYQQVVDEDRRLMKTILFRNWIRKHRDNFFDDRFEAPCPRIDNQYR